MSDPATSSSTKESLVCSETKSRYEELTTHTAYVVTWNVGNRFPDNISLRNLLDLNAHSEQNSLPDIYAIGLQEVHTSPPQHKLGLFKTDPWVQKVKDALKPYDYVAIDMEQMQGLQLSVFVRRIHVPQLRDIHTECTRTGFGGIWGHKGAVSIRFTMYGLGFTFVSAHLAAHDHHLEEHLEDYKQILENHHYHVDGYREIFDHDYVFWFGDLNFRLQGDDSPAKVRDAALKEDMLPQLLQRDQLQHVRVNTQEAFQLLHERLPAFPPTFKFKEGTSDYDLKRRPAWTDRILYAVQPLNQDPNMPLAIEQRSYKSHPGYSISDHKPVSSEFSLLLNSNFRAPCVEFTPILVWHIGEENIVEYSKPVDFEENENDYIAILPSDYENFNSFETYEYANQAQAPPLAESQPDSNVDGPPTTQDHVHHHRHGSRLPREQHGNAETVRIDFTEDIDAKEDQSYVLIYFISTGQRFSTSIGGVSNVFRAEKRSSSPCSSKDD